MDTRSLRSHLTGRMTFGVGGEMLRVTDVALDLKPAHTDLLRRFNGEPFPYDWQGALSGRVVARGGPVRTFRIDEATLTYDDAHVPGAQSRFHATGMADIFTPAEAILKGVDVRIDQLDLRTPRYVNPLFVELNGIVRGTMRLDSLWYDVRFSRRRHGACGRSGTAVARDGERAPNAGGAGHEVRRGHAGGAAVLHDHVPLLSEPAAARQRGGQHPREGHGRGLRTGDDAGRRRRQLSYSGRMDAFEPDYSATGAFRVRNANLQALFGDSRFPQSNLSLVGEVGMHGATLASLQGPLRATIDQFSRIADVRVFGGSAQRGVRFGARAHRHAEHGELRRATHGARRPWAGGRAVGLAAVRRVDRLAGRVAPVAAGRRFPHAPGEPE